MAPLPLYHRGRSSTGHYRPSPLEPSQGLPPDKYLPSNMSPYSGLPSGVLSAVQPRSGPTRQHCPARGPGRRGRAPTPNYVRPSPSPPAIYDRATVRSRHRSTSLAEATWTIPCRRPVQAGLDRCCRAPSGGMRLRLFLPRGRRRNPNFKRRARSRSPRRTRTRWPATGRRWGRSISLGAVGRAVRRPRC